MIRISRVSLRNFKSFRRISIPIPLGFTAVVGPNGTGKSNIVDAICFVLGRSSSKSLRAERFSDLIFNGGKKGKPATKASVSLYIDNAARNIPINSKEVKISRTIDLSGNSVYRLNRKRTTRNEILDLLSVANVHPDGHNIVLQGDVTRIIDMSPVERRETIDEIAGIAEYDEKKRKALRELEKVSSNISHAGAVLREVKGQMQKLETEKTDALRHEHLKGEIRTKKGTVLSSKHLKISEDMKRLKVRGKEQEERVEKLQRYMSTLADKLGVKRKEVENLNSTIVLKEETEHFSVFKEVEKIKNELKYREDRLDAIKDDVNLLEDRKAAAREEIEAAKRDIDEHIAQNKELESGVGKAEKEILKLKGQVKDAYADISKVDKTSAGLREKLETLQLSLDEKRENLLEIERKNALLTEKNAQKDTLYTELATDIKEKRLKLKGIEESIKTAEARKKEIDEKSQKNEFKKRELVDRSAELKGEIGKLNTVLQLKRDAFARLDAKYKALEHIRQKRLSFNKAVDEILKLKDEGKIKGIYGPISALGKVNQRFSKALEVAAGRGTEFIVVEDDRTAEACIDHLKKNRIGRATFLPLKNLRPIKPSEKAAKLAKRSHGFAFELVEFNKKFELAFALVFRNTVVVKDVEFARKAGIGDVRMVTLDGDLIEPSGMMSGGFYVPKGIGFEEVDTTKMEVDALRKEIEKLEKNREVLLKEDARVNQELEEIGTSEVEAAREMEALKERIKALSETRDDITDYAAEKEASKNQIRAQMKEFKKDLKKDGTVIEELRAQVSALGSDKKDVEEKLSESKAEKIIKDIRALETKIFAIEREREGIKTQISLNNSRINEILKPNITKLERELKGIDLSMKEKSETLKDADSGRKEFERELSNVRRKEDEVLREIKRLKDKRAFFIKSISLIGNKRNAFEEELDGVKKGIELSNIEMARLETKLETVAEELKEFSDLDIELLVPIDTIEMEKEIVKMEVEMASLEPINMRAVEDYEEIKEKFEGLDIGMEKLLSERDSINRLIGEIEHRKKAVFMEVFENIAMNFRRIFSQLSEGGTADLLLDEEAPLDGGLQIRAMPEGKNPQYIELMSGGEKTLTALSFIFAIQRYQPAPFYIMDEIDMFLDDSNVEKISDLVRESSKEAQFVVVSLKDNMMTSANQLFGVSIDEGVSKLVGVELEKVGS
ncbi:MAG: chromosome segregation protein SMC [Candidatus Hydrothermarchaeaceae archaeon]